VPPLHFALAASPAHDVFRTGDCLLYSLATQTGVLFNLAAHSSNSSQLSTPVVLHRVYRQFTAFPQDVDVNKRAADTLYALMLAAPAAAGIPATLVAEGLLPTLLTALAVHGLASASLTASIVGALWLIALDASCVAAVIAAECVAAVSILMSAHIADVRAQESCCGFMFALSTSVTLRVGVFGASGASGMVSEVLMAAMVHASSGSIHRLSCALLCNLSAEVTLQSR
jgi:hypothetical protein